MSIPRWLSFPSAEASFQRERFEPISLLNTRRLGMVLAVDNIQDTPQANELVRKGRATKRPVDNSIFKRPVGLLC